LIARYLGVGGRKFKSCHSDQIKPSGLVSDGFIFALTAGFEIVSETTPRRRRGVVGGARKKQLIIAFLKRVTEIRSARREAVPRGKGDIFQEGAAQVHVQLYFLLVTQLFGGVLHSLLRRSCNTLLYSCHSRDFE